MSDEQRNDVKTTGHVWDDNLQEYNNPLPRWWLWSFYATVVFSILYWFWYPTWPLPDSKWTTGAARIEVHGVKQTWSTRALLEYDLQHSPEAKKRQENLSRFAAFSINELDAAVKESPQMSAFANAIGRTLFADNCAACHGAGAQGFIGLYPNLVDDDWLWGGDLASIYTSLVKGRNGIMPSAKSLMLSDEEVSDVAHYVLTLSQIIPVDDTTKRGQAIFEGKGTCATCHGIDGKGIQALGSANLTDQIWTMIDVPGTPSIEGKLALVKQQITHGVVDGQRQMPAWNTRLNDAEIKALAVYIRNLSGAY